jgi:hypothetical protein
MERAGGASRLRLDSPGTALSSLRPQRLRTSGQTVRLVLKQPMTLALCSKEEFDLVFDQEQRLILFRVIGKLQSSFRYAKYIFPLVLL